MTRLATIGQRECVFGFDWSMHQLPQALAAAKVEGHEFVVLKASEGVGYLDPAYHEHCWEARSAGLSCGAYHFARPGGRDPYGDGRAEAEWFLSLLEDDTAFVALDLESSDVGPMGTTAFAVGFWDYTVESARFPWRDQRLQYVGAYFNWVHTVELAGQVVLWLPSYTAGYARDPDPERIPLPKWSTDLWPSGWDLWQYTSSGTVAGLHPSDVNVATSRWLNAIRNTTLDEEEPVAEPKVIAWTQPGSNWALSVIGRNDIAHAIECSGLFARPLWPEDVELNRFFGVQDVGQVADAWFELFTLIPHDRIS